MHTTLKRVFTVMVYYNNKSAINYSTYSTHWSQNIVMAILTSFLKRAKSFFIVSSERKTDEIT